MKENRQKLKIGENGVEKYHNRYPLSGKLYCPHCGKSLKRRQGYKKRIEWVCSTYIKEGKSNCIGIIVRDQEVSKENIIEQTVIEEVFINGEKHYRYTSKTDFNRGIRSEPDAAEAQDGGVLPRVHRPRRAAIKL